jgi:fatty-acyl-CoA synthase
VSKRISEKMILTETLRKASKLFPQKQAIVCGGKRWTYQEFHERVNRFSGSLKAFGIHKDDKVAILLPNCHAFLEVYYGIAQIGATSVPINIRLSPGEIAFILQDSESKVLISDPVYQKQIDPVREKIPEIKKIVWTGDGIKVQEDRDLHYEKVLEQGDPSPPPETPMTGEDIAQIYYTSGTTGRPKGVMLSHKNVMTHALGTIAEIHLTDRDVWIHVAPLGNLGDHMGRRNTCAGQRI